MLDNIATINFGEYRRKEHISSVKCDSNANIKILKIVLGPTMNKIIISYLKEVNATHHKS